MAEPRFITRKEIAQLLECSPRQVVLNERRWGIARHRADLNPRCVRYHRPAVVAIFEARGMLPSIGKNYARSPK